MRPCSKAGLRRPGSRPEAARAPALGGPGAEKGAQLQLGLVLMERKTDWSSTHLRSAGSGHRAPRPSAVKDNKTPSSTPAASLSLPCRPAPGIHFLYHQAALWTLAPSPAPELVKTHKRDWDRDQPVCLCQVTAPGQREAVPGRQLPRQGAPRGGSSWQEEGVLPEK